MAEQLYATLKTSLGDIEVRLFPNHAPKTVKNFVELALGEREWTDPATGTVSTNPLYDGTVFHRVISGFMIQGGDPLGTGIGGPGYKFEDEFHPDLRFDRPYLNRKHTIFGEVVDADSQKVVDKIASVAVSGPNKRPEKDVVLETVLVEKREN